ncbi:hypothetical protein K1719_000977 [Acacia pycnantha]|nr:hypothetical protein K1719_000977 [Acacia pycnantha]
MTICGMEDMGFKDISHSPITEWQLIIFKSHLIVLFVMAVGVTFVQTHRYVKASSAIESEAKAMFLALQ